MKKIIVALLCVVMCFAPLSVGAAAAKEAESTTFVLEVDVNQRYTDIVDATEDAEYYQIHNHEEEEKQAQTKRNTYIAVLVAALVVSVIVLVVSLKRVPKEDEIVLGSETNANKKTKE